MVDRSMQVEELLLDLRVSSFVLLLMMDIFHPFEGAISTTKRKRCVDDDELTKDDSSRSRDSISHFGINTCYQKSLSGKAMTARVRLDRLN